MRYLIHLQQIPFQSTVRHRREKYTSEPRANAHKKTLKVAHYSERTLPPPKNRLPQFFISVAPDTIGASLPMFFEILRDWEQNPELNGISADKVGT